MTRIKLRQLIWDEWNESHIQKHRIAQSEVEEAVQNVSANRRGYSGRIVLIGRSGKRIIAIVLSKEKSGEYYVITARDADKEERRLLYEQEKKDT